MRPGKASFVYRYCVAPLVMQMVHGAPADCVPPAGFVVLPSTFLAPGGAGILILISLLNVPSVSNTCIRALPRSATYMLSLRSTPMLCGVLNCPGPVPFSPHDFRKFPSLSYLATREFT